MTLLAQHTVPLLSPHLPPPIHTSARPSNPPWLPELINDRQGGGGSGSSGGGSGGEGGGGHGGP